MISQTAEYALRAAVTLAANHDACLTTQHIADATLVPADYLSKVLQLMSRAGLLQAQRGLHGGFKLKRSPSEITLLEVIETVEELPGLVHCPTGLHENGATLCALHQALDKARQAYRKEIGKTTIADILNAKAEHVVTTVRQSSQESH